MTLETTMDNSLSYTKHRHRDEEKIDVDNDKDKDKDKVVWIHGGLDGCRMKNIGSCCECCLFYVPTHHRWAC